MDQALFMVSSVLVNQVMAIDLVMVSFCVLESSDGDDSGRS